FLDDVNNAGVSGIDMETSALMTCCAYHGIPFASVGIISDIPFDQEPDANQGSKLLGINHIIQNSSIIDKIFLEVFNSTIEAITDRL
ncbi:MAG: hypothetical protein OMM_13250, partial [Candidatus Magnetoglobus multicellularis str. Araruama]